MNGVAANILSGNASEGSVEFGDRESGAEAGNPLVCDSPGSATESTGAPAPDLRWLGMMSCMGSALITLVGAVLITGHLLSADDAKVVAEDEGSVPGYTVAAGSD